MQTFVTGATGVFGRRIVDRLSDRNHGVVGLSRDPDGDRVVEEAGGYPVRGDVLDRESLESTLGDRTVDVVVHAATKLPTVTKTTAEYWERNDRVRLEGARNLLATVGDEIDQFVFPSVVWVARQPNGSRFDEDAKRHPTRATQSAADVEDLLSERGPEHGFDATILRTGLFYGPADGMTRQFADQLLTGDMPVIGGGILGRTDAELSLVHEDDAADAIAQAVEAGIDGCYHVVDEEPVTVAEYLRTFANLLDAAEPSRIPWWVSRPFAGKDAVRFMTSPMPTTNERFCEATGWQPTYGTYRDGLEHTVETWREDGALAEFADTEKESPEETPTGKPV